MTSIATMVGAVPLVLAGGPGSASRSTIGIVVIFGVGFSTLLSLFVVPAFYALLAPYTRSPEAVANELRELEATTTPAGDHLGSRTRHMTERDSPGRRAAPRTAGARAPIGPARA